jgi:sirohydrochlorin ferrochelatase
MSAGSTSPALVALAHGSRDPRSAVSIRRLVDEVRSLRPGLTVEAAFLELSEPGFDEVVALLAGTGTRDLVVVPLLLTEAYHARVDLPAAVDLAASRHPGLRIRRAGVLGTDDDALLDVLDRRLAPALSEGGGPDGLVLTSAGSSDVGANEQVAGLARRWGARHGLPALGAFASASSPDPGEAVRRLHAQGCAWVAVGRLFLAPGTLADRAAGQAHDAGARAIAEVLGPDPVVAGLVLERFDAVAEEVAA